MYHIYLCIEGDVLLQRIGTSRITLTAPELRRCGEPECHLAVRGSVAGYKPPLMGCLTP